jgi:SHS2 domain-containing protein
MKILDLEPGDDVIVKFIGKTLVEVFEHEDTDLYDPVEEVFEAGEEVEVNVVSVNEFSLDVQFGDGSVAFISPKFIEFVDFV